MSTLNRTFSVRNGIDVANTVVLDSNRNASNLASVNANSFVTVAGLDVTLQANNARDTANGAYAQANGAYAQANGAYAQANGAYAQANGAFAQANGAYAQANSAANTVRVSANGGATLSSKQLNFVNTSTALVTVADSGNGNANVSIEVIGGGAIALAYDQANSAYSKANAAYDAANTKVGTLTGFGAISVDTSTTANVKNYNVSVNVASTTQIGVTKLVDSVTSTDTANAATANAVKWAYDFANSKVSKSGDIISGDLEVQGNLYLTGNATYINVATIKANDSMIQLSVNSTSDVVDIGFVGHYSNGATSLHSGIIRHASDQKFYIFDGYGVEPTNNIIDIASANVATLVANLEANSITLGGNGVATAANTNAAYAQANTARTTANDAYAAANTANTNAVNAYGQANTANTNAVNAYAQANTARTTANDAYAAANTANSNALNAYAAANTADGIAKDAYAAANNRVLKAGDTMTGALTITTSGIGLSVANANVTYSLQVGSLNVTTNTVTTATSGQVVLDKFPATQLASVKYFVQANSATDYHTTEIVLVQDATNVWLTEYGSIQTGPSLGTFSADISSGDVRLLFTAVNNVNTIRSVRYGIRP